MVEFIKAWKKLVIRANTYGVPMPLVHDPKTKSGSVSLTLVFVSSILVVIGIVGKWSGIAGGIDMSNAMDFFYASSALYFGRKWTLKSGVKIDDVLQEGTDQETLRPKE